MFQHEHAQSATELLDALTGIRLTPPPITSMPASPDSNALVSSPSSMKPRALMQEGFQLLVHDGHQGGLRPKK